MGREGRLAELPNWTPEYFQILVVRELRKAGFEVGEVRVHRRSELPEPQRGFVLELTAALASGAWGKRALVACRRQDDAGRAGRDVVEDVKSRLADAQAEIGIIIATTEYQDEAVTAAHHAGIALFRVIDGRKAYDRSGGGGGYGTPDHYPAWLPAHTVEVVDRDAGGQIRARLLEPEGAAMVLAAFETH
jgi:restriction endonuclease